MVEMAIVLRCGYRWSLENAPFGVVLTLTESQVWLQPALIGENILNSAVVQCHSGVDHRTQTSIFCHYNLSWQSTWTKTTKVASSWNLSIV